MENILKVTRIECVLIICVQCIASHMATTLTVIVTTQATSEEDLREQEDMFQEESMTIRDIMDIPDTAFATG